VVKRVPYLSEHAIEAEATLLLAEFGRDHYPLTKPPTPVDDIVELQLKLCLEIQDLRKLFGFGDAHGAIWFSSRKVAVDRTLDPAVQPSRRGRYHFTLAHEAGHWRLHRHLYLRDSGQGVLFADADGPPDYVCRSGDKLPVEVQANRFAANLLMPREMVKQVWEEWRGDLRPVCSLDLRDQRHEILAASWTPTRSGATAGDVDDNALVEHWCKPLAGRFEVSPEAMRIRLEELGLVVHSNEALLFD
jgi:hypothetical protein